MTRSPRGSGWHARRLAGEFVWPRLAAALLLVTLVACARIVPPSGGPEDRSAPTVLLGSPDSGAVRVPTDAPLRLGFSEAMNRSSVRDWLLIAPWPGKMDCRWEKDTLICVPLEGWRAQTTYAVLLGTGAEDRRGNPLGGPVQSSFSTGDSLADGLITGTLRTRSLSSEGVMLHLFSWPPELQGPLPAEAALRPDPRLALRLGQTDSQGSFRIPFVPRGVRFLLGAHFDRSGNRAFDEGADLWGFAEFAVVCPDTGDGHALVDVHLVYADEPGELRGTVIDSACMGYVAPELLRARADSLRRLLAGELDAMGFARDSLDRVPEATLSDAERDSLAARLAEVTTRLTAALEESLRCSGAIWVAARAAPDSLAAEIRTSGSFALTDLPPGFYRVAGFRDLNGNGARDPREPSGVFGPPVELLPGRVVEGVDFELTAPAIGEE